jgi:argininosuccinate lyase
MTLWEGRFSEKLDPAAWAMNTSLPVDRRLAEQDVKVTIAWVSALEKAGVLTDEESGRLTSGLVSVSEEFERGIFTFTESDEDIHTAVERRLGELVGPLAGKLRTGRSRNDQVATDFRLWMLEILPELDNVVQRLQSSLLSIAEHNLKTFMPGYTHMQRAQPITLAHWSLSHFWPLQRDRNRFDDLRCRVAVLPLGCGALAGTAFPIDRLALSAALGFDLPAPNSLDAVSDRDFVAEFLFCSAMTGVHLSKLAENVILFSAAEFGFFELSDAFSTGSSLMPQKKNPDLFELARAKTGTLIGLLTGLLATLKGLPSTYDKDLQEDKSPVFQAADTLLMILPVLACALETMIIKPEKMLSAIDASIFATDLADYLVRKGVPFREAHAAVGKAICLAAAKETSLNQLSLNEWQSLGPFESDVHQVFDPLKSVNLQKSIGGTSPESVQQQIQLAKRSIYRKITLRR